MTHSPKPDPATGTRIAVTIPCYNEVVTIGQVIRDFRTALPMADIYVYDNNSTDDTISTARAAGAIVRCEKRQGKGHVVRRIFTDVDADVYIIADGDGTYDATMAPKLVELMMENNVDMVVGTRNGIRKDAGRDGHAFGNRIFNRLYSMMFGCEFTDIFSGYRVFTRRFVKSFPAISTGFEIETELSAHCSQLFIATLEHPTPYGVRPQDSHSKLRTFRDGFHILATFIMLAKETRPSLFFGMISLAFMLIATALAIPLFITYAATGLVPRFPTAILATGLGLTAIMMIVCGLVLDSLARARIEVKRALFLRFPPPEW